MKKLKKVLALFSCRHLFYMTLVFFLGNCSYLKSESKLRTAEELSRQKKYDQAISAYRQHLDERLATKDRPEWENPYFYLILIGDIQLGTGQIDQALQTYLEAEKKEVDKYLISDRIRSVAKAYEDKGQFDPAIELLVAHRQRDPLLFDSMLDRINKAKTLAEEQH